MSSSVSTAGLSIGLSVITRQDSPFSSEANGTLPLGEACSQLIEFRPSRYEWYNCRATSALNNLRLAYVFDLPLFPGWLGLMPLYCTLKMFPGRYSHPLPPPTCWVAPWCGCRVLEALVSCEGQ